MNAICTIVTSDYLHYALTLNESLLNFQTLPIYILIVDDKIDESPIKEQFPNIHFLSLEDISKSDIANKIISKYKGVYEDALRWSLKSVLASYLLDKYEKVLVLDCDLCFYNDYNFLFEELEMNNVLLTPHWRNSDPYSPHNSFDLLFYSGLFNAGFLAVNKKGKEVMDWWAMCCEYKCEINIQKGHYVDQTYLNLMPIYFENVKTLRHKGCNISEWNRTECKRTQMSNGQTWINEKYPIVFIHFTGDLVKDIKEGKEPLLTEHLNKWQESLTTYAHLSEPYRLQRAKELQELEKNKEIVKKSEKNTTFENLKQKIRIRTRILRFIQG